jgi:hypothetical protein
MLERIFHKRDKDKLGIIKSGACATCMVTSRLALVLPELFPVQQSFSNTQAPAGAESRVRCIRIAVAQQSETCQALLMHIRIL